MVESTEAADTVETLAEKYREQALSELDVKQCLNEALTTHGTELREIPAHELNGRPRTLIDVRESNANNVSGKKDVEFLTIDHRGIVNQKESPKTIAWKTLPTPREILLAEQLSLADPTTTTDTETDTPAGEIVSRILPEPPDQLWMASKSIHSSLAAASIGDWERVELLTLKHEVESIDDPDFKFRLETESLSIDQYDDPETGTTTLEAESNNDNVVIDSVRKTGDSPYGFEVEIRRISEDSEEENSEQESGTVEALPDEIFTLHGEQFRLETGESKIYSVDLYTIPELPSPTNALQELSVNSNLEIDPQEQSDHSWEEIARELETHGVQETRAKVVALKSDGRTHAEIARELGLGTDGNDRSQVTYHLNKFEEKLSESKLLMEALPLKIDL